MKKLCYIACIIILFSCAKEDVFSPENPVKVLQVETVKSVGGSKNDVLQSVINTSDGGYVTFGYTQSNDFDITNKNNESFDFWVMKFSSENNLLWQKTYGGSDDDRGYDIITTNDGGFTLLGYSKSIDGDVTKNAGNQDFWIVKITSDGTILWQKTFGYLGLDNGTTLIQTKDNGYLITGVLDVSASQGQGNSSKNSLRHAGGDVWAIKLNANGEFVWSKYFGGSFTDTPFGVVETADNNYIIAASSDSNDVDITNNKGSYDFWIFKIDADGKLVWEQSFGGSEIDEPRAITSTNDGNFIVLGDTRSSDKDITINNGGADLWMLKIDADGKLIWQKTIGGSSFDVSRSIHKTFNGDFLISGSSRSADGNFTNKGKNDAWILKVNANGNIIWQKNIGGSEFDFLYDAIELENGNVIAVGESNSLDGDVPENKGFSDALLIRLK